MPYIDIAISVPTATGEAGAAGTLSFQPTVQQTEGSTIVLPKPFTVQLDGQGKGRVWLGATNGVWAWRVTRTVGGVTETEYVSVHADDTQFAALSRVDPDSLTPTGTPDPAWVAMARSTVTSGLVGTDGHLTLERTDGTSVDAGHVVGPAGATGPQGAQGAPGPMGAIGPTGPTGPEGPQGPQGDPGPTGAQGPKGDTGATGPQGIQGLTGPKGDTGATGPTGPKGDTGATGPQGPQGVAGPAGPQGATGATGPQGPQGTVGATGPAGPANSLAVGTVTTGAAGSSAAATITGTSPNQTINLTIPQGVAGATGATGSTGPQGPAGATGPTGPKGDTGATGATGPQGPAGPANSLAIGTVTTGAPGSSAAATITGTSPNQTLGLTIPQGVAGPQGPAGPAPTATVTTTGLFTPGSNYTVTAQRMASYGGIQHVTIELKVTTAATLAAGSNTLGSFTSSVAAPTIETQGSYRGSNANMPGGACAVSTGNGVWITLPSQITTTVNDIIRFTVAIS